MPFRNIIQPKIIEINNNLRLRVLSEEQWKVALKWYQNTKVLYYSEGIQNGKVYNMDIIKGMYKYLNSIGELYFIEIYEYNKWISIGDVTLSEKNMPIVIGNEKYWGKKIGSMVIDILINRAKILGLREIYIPEIYNYNNRSKKLFKSFGFIEVENNDSEKSKSYVLPLS